MICFYVIDLAIDNFRIIALNQNFEKQKTIHLYHKMASDYSYFFKCIHLKEETGVFIFYRYSVKFLKIKIQSY